MMAVQLVIGGACEDIILPCSRDTFYADANSCGHYYRCQGYQVWRNKCPPGTASLGRGSTPCNGRNWQCDKNNPEKRCSRRVTTESPNHDGCKLKFNLPCQNETRFLDPVSCGHYLTCQSREQGNVLSRKSCDLPAQCHRMKNNQFCVTEGQAKCHKTVTKTVGVLEDDGGMGGGMGSGAVTPGDPGLDRTALTVGLVMAVVISFLIVGFLVLIFYKRKQKQKKPPSLPALTISAPIPINSPGQSLRYSHVDRPVSSIHYSEPNNYSEVDNPDGYPDTPGPLKGDFYSNPADGSGLYEEIESCRGGVKSPVYSTPNLKRSTAFTYPNENKSPFIHSVSERSPGFSSSSVNRNHDFSSSSVSRSPGFLPASVGRSPVNLSSSVSRSPGFLPSSVGRSPVNSSSSVSRSPGFLPASASRSPVFSISNVRSPVSRPFLRAKIQPRRPIRSSTDTRPLSDSFQSPELSPPSRPDRPFSLTSLSFPRPPIEPPRDSCQHLDAGYSNPYFVFPNRQTSSDSLSPTSPGNLSTSHKYFVLEKEASDIDAETVSLGTTYCEIDDAHFLRDSHAYQDGGGSRKSYSTSFV